MDGSIVPYQNTTEGAEIFFKCNAMFVPSEKMTAVCGTDQRWDPDPADLTCTCKSNVDTCLLILYDCVPPPVDSKTRPYSTIVIRGANLSQHHTAMERSESVASLFSKA